MPAVEPGISWDFFIAYERANEQIACELYDTLAPNWRVFLDKRSMLPGDDWDVITEALRGTRIFVVLISVNVGLSPYLRDEIARALELKRSTVGRRVVPVCLDGRPAPEHGLPYGLASLTYLELPVLGIRGVAAALGKLGRPPREDVIVVPPPRAEASPAPEWDPHVGRLIDLIDNLGGAELADLLSELGLPRRVLQESRPKMMATILDRATRRGRREQIEDWLDAKQHARRQRRFELEARLSKLLEAEFDDFGVRLDPRLLPHSDHYARVIAPRESALSERIEGIARYAERQGWMDQAESLAAELVASAEARRLGPEAAVLDEWRRETERQHERLIPFFPDAVGELLDRVFVKIDVERLRGTTLDETTTFDGVTTLHGLMSESFHDRAHRDAPEPHTRPPRVAVRRTAGRWVIIGDPGSGKTTAARHLVRQLARSGGFPVPVYLSLFRLIASRQHPFELAEAELSRAIGPRAAGLRDALFRAAKREQHVWLILDGFDEVAPRDVNTAIIMIKAWANDLPYAVIAVLSRPIGYRSLEPEFHRARVRPLSVAAQRELLGRWCAAPLAEQTWDRLQQPRSRLRAIIPNPLMLTLVAMLATEQGWLPLNRVQLYRSAIDLLLRRGHSAEPRGVRDRFAARRLLGRLSCVLQEEPYETWSQTDLHAHLSRITADEPRLRALLATWNSPEDFLHDVAHNSGLIGAHDGPREPWRYLHRSLREFLVAEALNNDSAVAITALLPRLRDDRVGRWGEPIALLCGLVSDPLSLLNEVKACNADLALRAILNAEGITPSAAAQFIRSTGQSLEHLERIARMWVASREEEDIERTRELLFLMVRPELAARELAVIHLVMERVGVTPRRETFFSCAGRLPPQDQTIPAMVRVSGGSFLMGQCHPDLRSSLDKKPRVETVTGFEIAIVPTTAEQYLPFAATFADSESSYADPKLPVTSVTWWHAYLFARWLGCTLPTEVQWEYACRAGSGTTFCSGDTVEDLDRVAWYKENSGGRLHAVAEKQPNQLGLYDMHGNVWEWCLNPTTSSDDEIHEEYWCTLRGGSWANEAQRARSADSSSWPAGKAYPLIGFRLVRPAK